MAVDFLALNFRDQTQSIQNLPAKSNMKHTIVKICGITDVEMALHAAEAGADAIGLVFYAQSPRAIELPIASTISAALPKHVMSVALFVNEDDAKIRQVIEAVNPAVLQFHGDEDECFCAQFGKPYWKAIRVNASVDLLNCHQLYPGAERILLDTGKPGAGNNNAPEQYGGSGQTFDWQRIPLEMRPQIILSGGLNVANVGSAIQSINPWAVDVSSGVEESKGVKSRLLISQFMNEVLRAKV